MKAWLAFQNLESPRTHNIRQLLVLLDQTGADVDPFWDFVELTAFAVQFRYEAYEDLNETVHRPELLEKIRRLLLQVEQLL